MSTRLAAFDVAGTSPVVRVWAIVDSPDEIEASPDTPIVNIEQFDLFDEDGDGIWEGISIILKFVDIRDTVFCPEREWLFLTTYQAKTESDCSDSDFGP